MALEWLKDILGDHYTEDIDRRVSAEIGRGFVARADFNAQRKQLDGANGKLHAFDGVDVSALKSEIDTLRGQLQQQKDGFDFDRALDAAIHEARGRNVNAIRGMLDVETLRATLIAKNHDGCSVMAGAIAATATAILGQQQRGPDRGSLEKVTHIRKSPRQLSCDDRRGLLLLEGANENEHTIDYINQWHLGSHKAHLVGMAGLEPAK